MAAQRGYAKISLKGDDGQYTCDLTAQLNACLKAAPIFQGVLIFTPWFCWSDNAKLPYIVMTFP
ncbi:MAG: hypothetical protein DRH17_07385 [Deltaproteobacteria bacterium]|nr:MAG: hypothetical protein DRH17_07385 [Deltaproteobacteria bacterium]